MQLSQGKQSLLQLAKDAYDGKVMLPDFQRPFVWTRLDIEELIESLLEDMFIGTFLINYVKPDDTKFKVIAIDGVETINKNYKENPHVLILDGQQRLTSFFYALYEPKRHLINTKNPYRFFIDLEKLLSWEQGLGTGVDETVFSISEEGYEYSTLLDSDGNYNTAVLIEKKWLPLNFLKDFTETWFTNDEWHYSKEQSKIIRDLIKKITDYHIMTIDVPVNESLTDIAKLFEKTNRTGIKLSVFDLLTARLYKFINLRSEREYAFENNHNIKMFVDNNERDTKLPYHMIQAIALASGFKSIKSYDILEISEKQLNDVVWKNAIDIVENKILAMFFQIDEFGIANESRISYKHMMIVYLAIFLKGKFDIDKIKIWHWTAIFTERYGGSTETKITKDYKELLKWFDDEEDIPGVVKNARELMETQSDIFSLKDKCYSGSASYKGIFNLLFMNKAKDFYEKDTIKYSASDLDDHHIFPRNFLEKKLGKSNSGSVSYDTILNKTLIISSTNKSISNKAPGDYIQEMIKIFGDEKKVKQVFESHFIDEKMYLLLKEVTADSEPSFVKQQFEYFTTQREKILKDRIRFLIGIRSEDSVSNEIESLVEKVEESKIIEFKSSYRRDYHQNKRNDELKYQVIKTIDAFLNTDGGKLFVGVDDNCEVIGIENDLSTFPDKPLDNMLLDIDSLLKKHFSNSYALIKVLIKEKDSKKFLVFDVKKSPREVYFSINEKKEFYIRRSASSISLSIEEAVSYINDHFKN